ncbi:MAG: hypothetical protein AABW73_01570 [Nanoarchaeota archaeon]
MATTVKTYKKDGQWKTLHVIEKTLKDHVIEWLAAILSVIGILLNANLFNITSFNTYNSSFYVWTAGNLLWITFAYKHKHWGVLITFLLYCIVNILAIIKNL